MHPRASRPFAGRHVPIADAVWVCACAALTGGLVGGVIGWLSRDNGGMSRQVILLAGLAGAMLAAGGLALARDWARSRSRRGRRLGARLTLRTVALVVVAVVGLSLWLGACSQDANASIGPHRVSIQVHRTGGR
jgi:hypothetical protein